MMMENGLVGRPFRSLYNGESHISKPISPNVKGAPTERIVLLSNQSRDVSERDRPDITTFGFRPIEQVNPSFDESTREYYLDSDLETIQEESSILESEVDDRSTICGESTCDESELSYNLVNGKDSDTPTLSSSSSSIQSQTQDIVQVGPKGTPINPATHNKIVYAKCLGPDENQYRELPHFKEPALTRYMDDPRNGLSEMVESPAATPTRNSVSSERNIELTMSDMFNAVTGGDLPTLIKFSPAEQSETVDERGNTLLHLAATAGQLQCIQYLMNGPLEDAISILNDELMTPAALAVMRGHLACVRWMVENTSARNELIASSRQASIDGSSMRPPLPHVAARYNQDTVLDWLCEQMIKEHLSIDSADYHSNTSTHEAAAQGHLKSLQVLVGRGASVTVLNSNGDTPGQVADKNGHDLCVGYLVVVETCMSLAQQLIRVKLENEGLVKENSSMKNQLQTIRQAKLAEARDSVEERFKATLQGLSSCDEDDGRPTTEQPKIPSTYKGDTVDSGESTVNQGQMPKVSKPVSPKTNSWSTKQSPIRQTGPLVNQGIERTEVNLSHSQVASPANPQTNRTIKTENLQPSKTQTVQHGERQYIDVGRIENHAGSPSVVTKRSTNHYQADQSERAKESEKNVLNRKPEEVHPSNHDSNALSGPGQGAKEWERMAMDEVLRLSRDTRYLPSPTISVRTEDSTMESKEVMRDRLAEASRWFLVQQAGGRAHMKDSKVSQRFRQNHGVNTFSRPKNYPAVTKPRPMVGPIHEGSKSGPIPAKIIPTNSATLSRPNRVSSRQPQQSRTTTNPAAIAGAIAEEYAKISQGARVPTHKPNQIGSIASIRPSSGKSNASNSSTLRTTSSASSSPSTTVSGRSVIENTNHTMLNQNFHTSHGTKMMMLNDKSRQSASNSPASSVRSGSEKVNSHFATTTQRSKLYPTANMNSSPQITVPLPTRNNSFVRKVQPPSPTINRGKSPQRSGIPTSSSVETLIDFPVNPATTTTQATSTPKKPNFSSYAYFVPRPMPQETERQAPSSPKNALSPSEGSSKKTSHTFLSSNIAKTSGKKKSTKFFRF